MTGEAYEVISWEPKGTPPMPHPPRNKALIAGLIKGKPMGFHSPLIRPAISWGVNVA